MDEDNTTILHLLKPTMSSIHDQTKTSNEEEDCLFAMELAGSSVMPMVLHTILELNVLDIMAKAGEGAHLSPAEIVSHLPTENPDAPVMLDSMLRLLVSYSVLSCSTVTRDNGDVERLYGLEPVCKYFVASQDGVSFSSWMKLHHVDPFMRTWSGLKGAILGGESPFTQVNGMTLYDYTRENPEFNQTFNMAMVCHTRTIVQKMLEIYKGFENLKELIDVGGGTGITSEVIVSKYPTIKCINLDLPHVIQSAPSKPGIQHVEGDMFASVPKGDCIVLKWILHNWDDAHCIKLLRNCYKALPDNGMLIVINNVIPNSIEKNAQSKVIARLDVIMMAFLPGGKERTEKQFEVLAKEAGFDSIKLVCCVYDSWVMEFYKIPSQ